MQELYLNNLIGIAKRGVELAIEKDEKHAQKWIDTALKKNKIKKSLFEIL